MLPKRTLLWLGALAAVLYTALALAFLRPIWEVFGDHLVPDRADPLFSLYVVKWVIHQARLGFPDLWNANIFYPAKGALAYSDPLFAQAAVISFFRNPVNGYNAVVFGSFVLTGLAVGWVLLASGVSPWGALLGGALYAFSPFRLHHLNHLAILFAPWLPLCLWSFDRFLAGCGAGRGAGRTTGRMIGRAALFLLFYALTLASGCYFAYMVHFPLLALLASRALGPPRDLLRPAALKALAPVGLLAALLLLVLFYPYWRITHQLRLDRDPSEIAGNAATLASYLSPAPQNLYSPFAPSDFWEAERLPAWQKPFVRPENTLFPGLLALPLAAWGFRAFWRRYRSPGERPSGLAWRLLSGVLLTLALLAYAAGDLYTLGLDREPALARWLPAAGPGVWLGLGLTFLGSLVLWATLRRRFRGTGVLLWREMEPWERGLVWIGGLSFLSSHALVYLPLARVVPGMSGMRVPARFAAFFGLTLVY
ncbi:MAG TPA: hypothetical protein VMM92_15200, partial [Thermoanaerobaculia bacterium]|nr:hypothetical protein [Thermoanaerobaculia bacterium]